MKRGIVDVLKRGFDNTAANWPIILLRFGEALLFALLAVLTAIVVVVPILVSIGIHVMSLRTLTDFEDAIEMLAQGWIVLVWIFVAVSVLLLVYVVIHSFVEAGCARVYVDGERVGGPEMQAPRARFAVFSMQRWMAGGADGWWSVFWIYNLAWGLAGLILLIPLLPTAVLMLLFHERPPAMIATGCAGLVLTLVLGIVVAILTGMWTTRAVSDWAARRLGARDALAHAWGALRFDFARHLVIALAVFVVAIAASSVFSTFSMFAAFGDAIARNAFVTMPLRVAGSLLNMIFSGAVTSWYLASYSSLAVEDRS